ncbi:MAG: hypothetical protein PF961_11595 [Planctomycetota bacterium]|jgi:hypothetical protein|nr:hypothetical protein [Planctomycetota bacterium]
MSRCQDCRHRVSALAKQRWVLKMLSGVLICAGALGAAALALVSADQVLLLPAAARLAGLLIAIVVVGAVVVRRLLQPLLAGASIEAAARSIEALNGHGDNRVLNACQFAQRQLEDTDHLFAEQVATSGLSAIDTVDRGAFLRMRAAVHASLFAALLSAVWIAYAGAYPHHVRHSLLRLLNPLATSGVISEVVITTEPSGALTRYAGDAISVSAKVIALGEDSVEPVLVIGEHGASDPTAGESIPMQQQADGQFLAVVRGLRRDRDLVVSAGGAYAAPIAVTIRRPPEPSALRFAITEPAYTGGAVRELPGPDLDLLSDSLLQILVTIDPAPSAVSLWTPDAEQPLSLEGEQWSGAIQVTRSGAWELRMPLDDALRDPAGAPHLVLASGSLRIAADQAPEVAIDTDERNRYLAPGSSLTLPIHASDDRGLSLLRVTLADAVDPNRTSGLVTWPFLGPPGRSDAVTEQLRLTLDPRRFQGGRSYIITAEASDFRPPEGQRSRSQPVVLRIIDPSEVQVAGDAAFQGAFAVLQQAIQAQDQARGRSAALAANLPAPGQGLVRPAEAIGAAQAKTNELIAQARDRFAALPGSETYASALARLARGECVRASDGIEHLPGRDARELSPALAQIREVQDEIYARLVALLGRIADQHPTQAADDASSSDSGHETDPKDLVHELVDGLEDLVRKQRRLLDRARSLAEDGPVDLTLDEEEILGELARGQDELAAYLEERLDDLSQLPDQDFADAALKEEWNEVFQEMQLAADALYKKKIELAVPHEQSGLESAESLIHNLEKWLAEAPDNIQWSMEDPMTPPDAPLADLPDELEDLVGDLLDDLADMETDVEDASSSWMDSLDKGAGWGTSDGPISNMSAKGVTGNVLPNQNEVGGRSGEGRQGRSHGQMVEAGADGKGGRETPTRLTPSPFEQGSVDDASTDDTGGATGGGKLSGYAGEGLVGPTPPPELAARMKRLAGQQSGIRQQAADLALELRKRGYPSGDLEAAVAALQNVATAAGRGDAVRLRQAHHDAVDALARSRREVATEARVRRERSVLNEHERELSVDQDQDSIPAGYETMIERYYQALQGRR